MGTRGAYGFYKNGVDKVTYNHFDSYPTGLGTDVATFVEKTSIEEMNKIFNRIILVNGNEIPTEEQITENEKYLNDGVSKQTEEDWYCLLRNAQGDLFVYKDGAKYMIDSKNFLKDSLFCEWAYVINLDTNKLEVYRGFQNKKSNNRYQPDRADNGYWGVKLIKEFDLSDMFISKSMEALEEQCDSD